MADPIIADTIRKRNFTHLWKCHLCNIYLNVKTGFLYIHKIPCAILTWTILTNLIAATILIWNDSSSYWFFMKENVLIDHFKTFAISCFLKNYELFSNWQLYHIRGMKICKDPVFIHSILRFIEEAVSFYQQYYHQTWLNRLICHVTSAQHK